MAWAELSAISGLSPITSQDFRLFFPCSALPWQYRKTKSRKKTEEKKKDGRSGGTEAKRKETRGCRNKKKENDIHIGSNPCSSSALLSESWPSAARINGHTGHMPLARVYSPLFE